MSKSYVTEVQVLIDEGLNEDTAVQTFQVLVKRFEEYMHLPETQDFREEMSKASRDRRRYFRDIIDEGCGMFPFPIKMSWRNVKFKPKRVKRCEICGDYFYDVSRNGNKITCFNFGVCEHEHKVRRKRAGTLMEPVYKRRVNEIPIDFSPAPEDKQGHAILSETEMTAWEQRENLSGQIGYID